MPERTLADTAGDGDRIEVELARVVQGGVRRDRLFVAAGSTLGAALEAAVRASLLQASDLQTLTVAVFGKARPASWRLHAGDRIELLGPLRVDPKLARQRRVEHRRAAAPKDKWRGAR
jgi:hypothetical protein